MSKVRLSLSLEAILIFAILLAACGVEKKRYGLAKATSSIDAYEAFLARYPSGKYSDLAKKELRSLYEEADWSICKYYDNISSYRDFLAKYPLSKYASQANERIRELEELRAWNKVKDANTIYAYENFINAYPKSSYVLEAKNAIAKLKEQKDWEEAERMGTVDAYRRYLETHPYGDHYSLATERMRELEVIEPEWQKVLKINTLEAYRRFVNQYPGSSYARLANQKIDEFDDREWNNAIRRNSIKAFQDYLSKFPLGKYIERADKRIIDLEVDAIFQGNHGQLPPMSKTDSGNAHTTVTKIEVHNKTGYRLTVRYSGVESRKIVLIPGGRTTVTLENGNYRVAASVDAATVRDYAGKYSLSGGEYSSEFWIETRRF